MHLEVLPGAAFTGRLARQVAHTHSLYSSLLKVQRLKYMNSISCNLIMNLLAIVLITIKSGRAICFAGCADGFPELPELNIV